MENTPWPLVMVPLPVPFTTTDTEGSPRRLSAVITTPYNCTTVSLKVSNWAFTATGERKAINMTKYRKVLTMGWGQFTSIFLNKQSNRFNGYLCTAINSLTIH
jgi:hypothetical protein